MTVQSAARRRARSVTDRILLPVWERLSAAEERHDELSARVEQLVRANERLSAHLDRVREELAVEFDSVIPVVDGARSLVDELVAGGDERDAGPALHRRFDHALLHAEARSAEASAAFEQQVRELRSSNRLTQALVDRLLDAARQVTPDRSVGPPPPPGPTGPGRAGDDRFEHASPRFDLLYRSFEHRHRGSADEVRGRQEGDYLELLSTLPSPELAIADLGCGRGELVQLLLRSGQHVVGVDVNQGQLVDEVTEQFIEADLFDWLDRQADGSLRAVVSMHVVEHLPLDLQVRLIFEARRTLAPGGVLVLETPNTLSLSVGASNFWVDPTHERPVHPVFLEFLAEEAGFGDTEIRLLHDVPIKLVGPDVVDRLLRDLNSLLLGPGDLALVAWA